MRTRTFEIQRQHWPAFLKRLDQSARERPVTIEVISAALGEQRLVSGVPLRGIGLSNAAGAELLVDAGPESHRVLSPRRIYGRLDQAGALEWLNLEDDAGTKTLLHFEQRPLLEAGLPGASALGPEVLVRDYMSPSPMTVGLEASLADVYELMVTRGIRHLPVVDGQGQLTGLVSERSAELAKRRRGVPPEDVTVGEVMARAPFSVTPDTPIDEAAAVMARRRYGSAVVLDEGRVVGIFTTTDALRALVDLRATERGRVRSEAGVEPARH